MKLLEKFTVSTMRIAAVLAAEGVFALTLPLARDPSPGATPSRRRWAAVGCSCSPQIWLIRLSALAIVAFMPNIWTTTLIVLAFFFAGIINQLPYTGGSVPAHTPCRMSRTGRSQSVQQGAHAR